MRKSFNLFKHITVWCFITTITTGLVRADVFPNNHHDGLADTSLHTYCFSAFAGDRWVGEYAMEVLRQVRDMTIRREACSTATDVVFMDRDIPGRIRGQYQCQRYLGDTCNSSNVTLDFDELDRGDLDWYDRRKTAVHEVGHSVGADHDNISAMRSGEVRGVALVWRRFSPHDVNHINANY